MARESILVYVQAVLSGKNITSEAWLHYLVNNGAILHCNTVYYTPL
jgi:hypothetical protein